MAYEGNISEDSTIEFFFNTIINNSMTTLSGTPSLVVYKGNNTTQSSAGITLTVDFDSVTGSNHVSIDTSADAFYTTGEDYTVMIAAGTVGGTTVVGRVVGSFSIEHRASGTSAATIRSAIGLASANLDTQLSTIDSVVDAILVDTAEIGLAGAGLTAIPWNSSWDTEVQSECNDALVALHLDHVFAADYDPASKPGVSTALFNEIIENDGGVSRFTANALEQAAAGGSSDWTTNEKNQIRYRLKLDGTTATPTETALPEVNMSQINGSAEPETGYTPLQLIQLLSAAMVGKSSNNGSTFRDINDTVNRITATVDSSGNRTAITYSV